MVIPNNQENKTLSKETILLMKKLGVNLRKDRHAKSTKK